MRIIDIAGRLVRRLAPDGSVGDTPWDGADNAGRALPAGLSVARLEGEARATLKVLKLK